MEHNTERVNPASSEKLHVALIAAVYQLFLLLAVSAASLLAYWIAAKTGVNPTLPPFGSHSDVLGVIALSFFFTAALPEPISNALNEVGIIQDRFDAEFIVRLIAGPIGILMLCVSVSIA